MARSCGRLRKASGLRRRPSAAAWRVAPSGVSRSSSPSGRLQDSIKDLKSGLSRNSEKTSWLWWRPHPLWCLWEEGCLQGGLLRWSLPDWNPHPPQQWAHPGIEESPQNRILKDPRGGYSRQQVRTPPEAFHHSLSGKPGESTKADLPLIQRHVEALTMAGEDFLGIWESKLNTVLCLQSQTDLVAVFNEYQRRQVKTLRRTSAGRCLVTWSRQCCWWWNVSSIPQPFLPKGSTRPWEEQEQRIDQGIAGRFCWRSVVAMTKQWLVTHFCSPAGNNQTKKRPKECLSDSNKSTEEPLKCSSGDHPWSHGSLLLLPSWFSVVLVLKDEFSQDAFSSPHLTASCCWSRCFVYWLMQSLPVACGWDTWLYFSHVILYFIWRHLFVYIHIYIYMSLLDRCIQVSLLQTHFGWEKLGVGELCPQGVRKGKTFKGNLCIWWECVMCFVIAIVTPF